MVEELVIQNSNPPRSFANIHFYINYCISKERRSLKRNLPLHVLTPSSHTLQTHLNKRHLLKQITQSNESQHFPYRFTAFILKNPHAKGFCSTKF